MTTVKPDSAKEISLLKSMVQSVPIPFARNGKVYSSARVTVYVLRSGRLMAVMAVRDFGE